MQEAIIELKDVVKKFGSKTVLNGVSLSINEGDILGIIGNSGSGKTTILNLIIGFLKSSSGSILYSSKKMAKMQGVINQIFGFASQSGSYYQKLSVDENLRFFGKMYNMDNNEIKQNITELLTLVELMDAKNKLANELSTGMQRRLDIACALMHSPKVLILDEPTEDLDPVLRKEILALIKRINAEKNTTIIMTSHLLGEIEIICNKIAILNNGKIIEEGSPDQLKDSYSKNYEISLQTKNAEYKQIIGQLTKVGCKVFDKKHRIIAYTDRPESTMKMILSLLNAKKEKIVELSLNKPSLEEVFESVTKRR